MKVLFVTREYPPFEVGGIATHTSNLVKGLERLNVCCKIISYGDPKLSDENVTFIMPSSSINAKLNCSLGADAKIPVDIIRLTRKANSLITKEKFDIVHVEEPYVGAFVRHRNKVTTIHDTSYGEIRSILHHSLSAVSAKRVLFYLVLGFYLEFMCLASSTAVIVPSPEVAREVLEVYRTPREKVRIIHNAVNLPNFSTLVSKTEAKRELGLQTEKFLIFTAAQHIPRKRLDVLLQAISFIPEEARKFQVVIAGDGPLKPDLMELTRKLGLEYVVEFPGWVSRDKLELYYRAADIFVLTSEYEAGPISLLEAMAFGATVVSSRIGGFPRLMRNGIEGLLFPVNNSAILSRCIRDLLDNPSIRMKMSDSARVFAKEFDWRRAAQKTKNLYENLL